MASSQTTEFVRISYLSGQFRIAIQTKRGCELGCAYCVYPLINGRKVRMRSPQAVVDEIEYLIGLGVNKFLFADNVFNVPEEHALEICEEILRRKLKAQWGAFYEISTMSENLLELAKQAGCLYFNFSPDAATDEGLSLLKKSFTHQDIERSIALVRKHKVKGVYNVFLLPGVLNLVQTFAHCFRWQRALRDVGGRIRLDWIRIEPGTEIHRLALAEGRLTRDTDMMPEDEQGLAELFYRHPNRYVDRLTFRLSTFFDRKGGF